MALEYKFGGRDKVVKGHTYPIKRADLDRALEEAGVTDVERVSYISSKSSQEEDGQVIGIWMKGEASIAGTWMKRSPGLLVASVPVAVSQEIKKLIEKQDILGRSPDGSRNWKKRKTCDGIRINNSNSITGTTNL